MNRESISIDFPQSTGKNVSPRRASMFASLPDRQEIGFMAYNGAPDLMGTTENLFLHRLVIEKRAARRLFSFTMGTLAAFSAILLAIWIF